MSTFSIHDVKTVDEVYDLDEVNEKLQSGWFLLSVGFETIDGETSKIYILGTPEEKANIEPQDDELLKFINRR